MNIKNIHIIFISASILLAFFFAVWSWGFAAQKGGELYKIVSCFSTAAGFALVLYMLFFVRKMRSL